MATSKQYPPSNTRSKNWALLFHLAIVLLIFCLWLLVVAFNLYSQYHCTDYHLHTQAETFQGGVQIVLVFLAGLWWVVSILLSFFRQQAWAHLLFPLTFTLLLLLGACMPTFSGLAG